jgi:hypothetical protein
LQQPAIFSPFRYFSATLFCLSLTQELKNKQNKLLNLNKNYHDF